ncbi:MAG: hypothetical protein R6V40_02630 [Candidatus Moraniibacteriota bacterium]
MIDFLTKIGVPGAYAGDTWLFLVFVVVGMALLVVINKKNLGALILSVYVAYVILSFAYFIPGEGGLKAVFFGVLIWLCYTGLKKMFNFSIKGKKIIVWAQTLFLSLLVVGMISSMSLDWFSAKELQDFFTPFSKKMLISENAKLIWTVLPFLSLFLMKKHKN